MATLLVQNKSNHVKVRWVLVYFIFVGIFLRFITRTFEINPQSQNYEYIVYISGMLLLCYFVMAKCEKSQISSAKIIGAFPKENVWLKLTGVTAMGLLFMIGSLITFASLVFTGLPDLLTTFLEAQGDDSVTTHSSINLILRFIAVVIVAPFGEEFLFRGVILNRWIEKWGATKALVASSFLFGIVHINVIGASMVALIWGILYLRYQTLWVTFFCHFIHNMVVFTFSAISDSEFTNVLPEEVNHLKILSLLLGVFLMAVSLLFLWASKLKFPRGYVQPSSKVQLIGDSGQGNSFDVYVPRSILGIFIAMISAVIFTQSNIYKSMFTSEPYRSLSNDGKLKIDSYTKRLGEIAKSKNFQNIAHTKKASVNVLSILADTYEEESKLIKDTNAARLAIQKAKKIREVAVKINDGKILLTLKVINEID